MSHFIFSKQKRKYEDQSEILMHSEVNTDLGLSPVCPIKEARVC